MDPLASIRSMMTPEMRASPQLQNATDAMAGKAIPFNELPSVRPTQAPAALPGVSRADAPSFDHLLRGLVNEVSDKQAASKESVRGLLGGQNVSLHQTMIAMEEASVSFQLMVEVRNKLLEAYQELMRMQV